MPPSTLQLPWGYSSHATTLPPQSYYQAHCHCTATATTTLPMPLPSYCAATTIAFLSFFLYSSFGIFLKLNTHTCAHTHTHHGYTYNLYSLSFVLSLFPLQLSSIPSFLFSSISFSLYYSFGILWTEHSHIHTRAHTHKTLNCEICFR